VLLKLFAQELPEKNLNFATWSDQVTKTRYDDPELFVNSFKLL